VRFRYSSDAPYALAGFVHCPPGTMLASWPQRLRENHDHRLLQCLNTTYDGMIKIDGVDLREINLLHLRTHIGVVPQENFLFSERCARTSPWQTGCDLCGGRAGRPDQRAEEFIERLPRGYDTPIREGGNNLSGGSASGWRSRARSSSIRRY